MSIQFLDEVRIGLSLYQCGFVASILVSAWEIAHLHCDEQQCGASVVGLSPPRNDGNKKGGPLGKAAPTLWYSFL